MFAITVGKQKYPGRHHKRKEHVGSSFKYNQCLLMTIHFYAKQIEDQASLFWGNLIHEWAVIQLWTGEWTALGVPLDFTGSSKEPHVMLNPQNRSWLKFYQLPLGDSWPWEAHKKKWVTKKLLRVRCARYQLVSTHWVRWP